MSTIDSLRALLEKATKAPLATADSVNNGLVYIVQANGSLSESVALCSTEEDAALFVALRNNIEALLAVASAAQALRRVEDMIDLYIECGPIEVGMGEMHGARIKANDGLSAALAKLEGM